jgi:hypothetical protein
LAGSHFLAKAPKELAAADEYADSMAVACVTAEMQLLPEFEVVENCLLIG